MSLRYFNADYTGQIILCNILCTINTQYKSRQDAIIKISLHLATCLVNGNGKTVSSGIV